MSANPELEKHIPDLVNYYRKEPRNDGSYTFYPLTKGFYPPSEFQSPPTSPSSSSSSHSISSSISSSSSSVTSTTPGTFLLFLLLLFIFLFFILKVLYLRD